MKFVGNDRDYLSNHQGFGDFWFLVEERQWEASLEDQRRKKMRVGYLFIWLSLWKIILGWICPSTKVLFPARFSQLTFLPYSSRTRNYHNHLPASTFFLVVTLRSHPWKQPIIKKPLLNYSFWMHHLFSIGTLTDRNIIPAPRHKTALDLLCPPSPPSFFKRDFFLNPQVKPPDFTFLLSTFFYFPKSCSHLFFYPLLNVSFKPHYSCSCCNHSLVL